MEERVPTRSSEMKVRIQAKSFASEFARSIVAWLKLMFVQL